MVSLRQRCVSRIVHLYPFLTGCGTFANSGFVKALAGDAHGVAWARLRNGMLTLVELNDFNGRAAFIAGDIDRKITWICSRIVRAGDVAIDVGSNIGLVTLTLAKLVGPQGRVFSFDANPVLIERLRLSLDRNDLRNVNLTQCGVGAEEGELSLHVPNGHSGRGSLVRSSPDRENVVITVPVRTLSELIPLEISGIRLLKIDVEGFEPQVLCGAEDLFERSPPDTVLFELNDLVGSASAHPSIVKLQEYGYEFFAIPKAYLRLKLSRFDPGRDKLVGHDLLACRKGRIFSEIGDSLCATP